MKKFYSFLILMLFPIVVFAVDIVFDAEIEYNGLYYALNTEKKIAQVMCYSENNVVGDITIPSTIIHKNETYDVTMIGQFSYCTSITSITIPNSVTYISDGAFSGCSSLTSIEIPNSVTYIGEYAFDGTAWFESQPNGCVYINSLLYIYKGDMPDAALKPEEVCINVREGTTQICNGAFSGCTSLTSISMPNSITSIGNNAFNNCMSLTSINLPSEVISIGSGSFYNCSSLISVVIPNTVTSIGEQAFSNCISLKTITLPNKLTKIADRIFSDCRSLSSVTMSNNLTSIGNLAFYCCTSLKSIIIPNSVTTIGVQTFENCSSLETIVISSSVNSIGYDAFKGTVWLENQTDGCLYINDMLYTYKGMMPANTHIDIREGTKNICELAFIDCYNLLSITIPNSVINIGGGVFYGCSNLKTVQLSENITSLPCCVIENPWGPPINYGFFQGCKSLESITLHNNIVEIGNLAFESCSSLISVKIPNSVTEIGGGVFHGCKALKTVVLSENIKSLNDAGLGSYDNSLKGFFEDCISLTSIEIPKSITCISDEAFYGCRSLVSIEIPDNVIELGSKAFGNCYSLRYAKLGNGFRKNEKYEKEISVLHDDIFYCEDDYIWVGDEYGENGEYVLMTTSLDTLICEFANDAEIGFAEYDEKIIHPFTKTTKLRYFKGPAKLLNNITEKYQTDFSNILTEIHITDGELNENGFNFINRSKKSLHTIDIAGTTNTAINDLAFYDCYKLENLMLPKNVENIGFKAFADCLNLKAIKFPSTLKEIQDLSFENCTKIDTIQVDAIVPPTITSRSFDKVSRDIEFIVPEEAREAYAEHEYWKEFIQGALVNVENVFENINIYTQNGILYFEGLNADYQVFDENGRLVYTGRDAVVSLPRGVYVVVVGDEVEKVVL